MSTASVASYRLSCPTSTAPEPSSRELFASVRADAGSLAESAASMALVAATASPSVFMTLAILGSMLR